MSLGERRWADHVATTAQGSGPAAQAPTTNAQGVGQVSAVDEAVTSGSTTQPGNEVSGCLCPAEQQLFSRGVGAGVRSRVALRLATRLRLMGHQETETREALLAWNQRNRPPLVEAELSRIVAVAFAAGLPYRLPCPTEGELPADQALLVAACPAGPSGRCQVYQAGPPASPSSRKEM